MVMVRRTGLLGGLAVTVGMLSGWAGHVAGEVSFGSMRQAEPTNGGVVVTPDGAHVNVWSPSSRLSQTFTIRNTSDQSLTFRLRTTCVVPVTECVVSPNTITLAAGASGTRDITYTSGPAGSLGKVQLNAWVALAENSTFEDVGSVNVRSVATSFAVSAVDVNPGTTLERGLCLTVALIGAASECGDLRIAHALPTTRTFDKARTPVLLYNSAHAHPYPLVAANVSVPIGTSMPDSVVATLRVGGVQRACQKWTGSQFPVQTRRRITLGFDGLNDTTGVYAYTLEVRRWSGTSSQTRTLDGQLVIVNRKNSPFRTGWWLAGLERLNPSTKLWVGGDGSVRQYVSAGTNVWQAQGVTHPDTLRWDGTNYIRYLPGGVQVRFNAAGQHVATRPRLGAAHQTTFRYSSGRLVTIVLPVPAGQVERNYTFNYTSNKLSSVTAPTVGSTARTTNVTVTSGRLTLEDPDAKTVTFGYDSAWANRIVQRTSNGGTVTTYSFDTAHKLSRSSTNMGSGQTPVVIAVRTRESQMLAPNAQNALSLYTLVNGPRTAVGDTTQFLLDRFGEVQRITNALGDTTRLRRTDARWPGLVSAVEYPTDRLTRGTYTTRGNVKTTTEVNAYADGQDHTTRYEYANATWPDFVKRVRPPEGDSIVMAYDVATGDRIWQQDARGSASRVNFNYNSKGLLSSVVLPGGARDSLFYNAAQANLSQAHTPRGFITTHYKDNIGRDTLVISQTDSLRTGSLRQRQRTGYDLMDRVVWTVTIGVKMNDAPAQTLRIEHEYGRDGNLTQTTRKLTPSDGISPLVTTWRNDRASRVVKEVAPDGKADSTVYDPAGNPIRAITRRGHEIVMVYDALNQLKERRTPGFVIQEWSDAGIPSRTAPPGMPEEFLSPYPMYGSGGSYPVPADTARFTYDAVGNLVTANNRDAQVTRTYYRNGLIETETQRIRTLKELSSGGNFTAHVYTLTYMYDGNGRRKQLQHPAKLAPRVDAEINDKTTYAYHAFGELAKVTDVLGHEYRFTYTPRTELDSLILPRSVRERLTYDLDGNIATHVMHDWGGSLTRNLTLRYDGRGRMVRSLGLPDSLYGYHSGLGYLVRTILRTPDVEPDAIVVHRATHQTLTNDALGNLRSTVSVDTATWPSGRRVRHGDWSYRYHGQTARQRASHDNQNGPVDTTWYDLAGNATFTYQTEGFQNQPVHDRASFYDAEGRLRAADQRRYELYPQKFQPYRGSFEEYRYDALGRRIWVRARRMCSAYENKEVLLECRQQLLRRTVWDDEQELWEIQMPEDISQYVENDTVTVNLPRTPEDLDPHPFYGRIVYTHGPRLDQPLGITRIGYVDFKSGMSSRHAFPPFTFVPGWSLRGDPDRQYFADSSITPCPAIGVGSTPCAWLESPVRWLGYTPPPNRIMRHWYGTLIEYKADKAGTFYRRNRYYDAATGRFTQEDPIGLAGGMNLYGFAEGDPVNFSDPFGLLGCPKGQIDVGKDGKEECRELLGGGSIFGHLFGGPILRGIKGFFAARLALRGVQAARAAGTGARTLSAAELGIRNARQFQATMGVVDDVATVRVGMIEASSTNPFTVIRNLERLGREAGATSVRVEGTIANEQLLRVLERRFGAVTEGVTTYFNIPIR